MQHRLSVTGECYVTIQGPNKSAVQVRVLEALGVQKAFDWFGNTFPINIIKPPNEEKRFMVACTSGEMMAFGENHSILCREYESARWTRKAIKDITEPVLVQLPKRKVVPDPSLIEIFDVDDGGLFLSPPRASDMPLYARKAAYGGITVSRRKTEARLDLDRRRPPCFATKYLAGSFVRDLDKSLNGMVRGGIITPPGLYDDAYLDRVNETGIIFEGASIHNSVPLLPPRPLEKAGEVYHILFDNPLSPVELTWCHS
jgi:hypothetical protein